MSETQPTTNILSDASTFNSAFESELIFYPAGVQDLYYLNNEALEIKGNKTYLIDASTGMIYSMTGIGLKGVRCYSSSMAKAVMNGDSTAPLFAEAEVSGTGNNIVYAGSKYLMDKNGNYVDENGNIVSAENKIENPNGFQIFADSKSANVYKLYNNGDLYAKGLKGSQLSTPDSEMDAIRSDKWAEITIPNEIGGYKNVTIGSGTIYVIDNNDELWAWGSNSSNKLGLTQEQQIEYTGRDAIKLNVANKKVKKVFDTGGGQCFVLTMDDKLYGCGANNFYYLGLGYDTEVTEFTLVNVPNPQNIDKIINISENNWYTLICYKDNSFLAAGSGISRGFSSASTAGGVYKYFTPVMNGYTYIYDQTSDKYVIDNTVGYKADLDIDGKVKKVSATQTGAMVLTEDNVVYYLQNGLNNWQSKEYGNDVKDIYTDTAAYIIIKNNGDVYAFSHYYNSVGTGENYNKVTKVELPEALQNSGTNGIKEIFSIDSTNFWLANNGKVYVSCPANAQNYISGTMRTEGLFELENAPEIISFYNVGEKINVGASRGTICALGKDGKIYSTGNSSLIYRNNILQMSWIKIASNVKDISLGYDNSIAYIDSNNDVYVAGDSSQFLGLNKSNGKTPTFTRLDDDKINGKAKQVAFGTSIMLIATTDGNLYSTGLYSADGIGLQWPNGRFPGWEEEENHYTLTSIEYDGNAITKVKQIDSSSRDSLVMTTEAIYGFGQNFYQHYFISPRYDNRKVKQLDWTKTSNETINNIKVSDIKKIFVEWSLSVYILNNGNVLINYGINKQDRNLGATGEGAKLIDKNDVFNGEKVIDASLNDSTILFLTENGNVYGWGRKNSLGINSTSSNFDYNIQKLNIDNVNQVVCGNGFAIAIKNDGTVYGTGTNVNGILGRWIGIDRKSPNSRYKTAFEWVECPELEI